MSSANDLISVRFICSFFSFALGLVLRETCVEDHCSSCLRFIMMFFTFS